MTDLDLRYDAMKFRRVIREFIAYALIKSRVCRTTVANRTSPANGLSNVSCRIAVCDYRSGEPELRVYR